MDHVSSRPIFYRLDGDIPYPVSGIAGREYHRWLEEHRHLDLEEWDNPKVPDDIIRVSTVFLGMDHSWDVRGGPILWETMIFAKGWPFDREQWRYRSAADAREGHQQAVELVALALGATTE